MGIYNRDYYRESDNTRGINWGIDGLTPVLKWLIIANVAVFLLQIFVIREVQRSQLEIFRKFDPELDKLLKEKEEGDPEADKSIKRKYPGLDKLHTDRVSVVQEWCELDTAKVIYGGQVWRLLTHAFCHDRLGVWHILFNMLCLYWFGGTLESMHGSREFLLFYLTSALVSAFAFVGLNLYTGASGAAIGASGAVMGVMMLYTMHFPTAIIRICWIIPVEMRWVMVLFVIWDLHPVLLALAGDQLYTGVAHAGHLGGLAFGFVYAKYHWRLEGILERLPAFGWRWKRRPHLRLAPDTMPDADLEPDLEMDRVDELLQKIFQSGQGSLTDEERAILQKASQRLKNSSRGGD